MHSPASLVPDTFLNPPLLVSQGQGQSVSTFFTSVCQSGAGGSVGRLPFSTLDVQKTSAPSSTDTRLKPHLGNRAAASRVPALRSSLVCVHDANVQQWLVADWVYLLTVEDAL